LRHRESVHAKFKIGGRWPVGRQYASLDLLIDAAEHIILSINEIAA